MILLWGGTFLIGGIYATKYSGISYFWIFESVIHILVGMFIIAFPQIAATLTGIVIGIWAIVIGITQIATTHKMGSVRYNKSLYIFNGILAIAFGHIIIFSLFGTDILLTVSIGVYSLLYAANNSIIAMKMRSVRRKMG
jgi:uncharacterized membrane protein HdeD (DUF308 family)